MRTTLFRDIFEWVVRLHGRDPRAEINQDMRRTLTGYINLRVRTIAKAWRWPEWELTEERAFRQIWNSGHQFYQINPATGKADEVFYIPGASYYKVAATAPSDPPVGTVPTNTTYFESLSPVDSFIAYDQTCRRSIGIVRGVYSQNPRIPTGSNNGLLNYHPSEKGVDVLGSHGPTVFVTYTLPVPTYTMQPWVGGRAYVRGDVVFDPVSGDCFQSLSANYDPPQSVTFWRRIPFLQVWEPYVTHGAFADSLMEFDQGGNTEAQVKVLLAQAAEVKANDYLQLEVDALVAQGQKLQWNFCQRGQWSETLPWSGGTVSELTDECQDEFGWVYPVPPGATVANWTYYSQIVSILTVNGTPSLEGLATAALPTSTLITIVISVEGVPEEQSWRLDAGEANPLDPGQVKPVDWNLVTNNKHWLKVI